jgi:galacturan 1,4-alpha-galacturonidase
VTRRTQRDTTTITIMHFPTITALTLSSLLTLATAAKAPERKVCTVTGLGGGRDDGPSILAAFKKCGTFGKIKLHGYYSVDTLLLTTGLDDVEIDLKGTRKSGRD